MPGSATKRISERRALARSVRVFSSRPPSPSRARLGVTAAAKADFFVARGTRLGCGKRRAVDVRIAQERGRAADALVGVEVAAPADQALIAGSRICGARVFPLGDVAAHVIQAAVPTFTISVRHSQRVNGGVVEPDALLAAIHVAIGQLEIARV